MPHRAGTADRHVPYDRLMSIGGLEIAGSPAFTEEESARYRAEGWWSDQTLSDAVRRNAERSPDRSAYVDHPDSSLSWSEFDRAATALAEQLAGAGVTLRDRVAVWHADSSAIHALFVAIERCGAVVVGIGARAGTREVAQILRSARPKILVTDGQRGDTTGLDLPALVLGRDGGTLSLADVAPGTVGSDSRIGPDDVFLINSTSGTTGLPKCVVHTQNRW